MKVTESAFLTVSDPRWRDFLGRCPHGAYHQPDYLQLAAKHEGGEPAAFWARCETYEMLLPLVLRSLPPELNPAAGLRDAVTPYGYPAVLINPLSARIDSERSYSAADRRHTRALLEALRDTGVAQGIVSVFCRMHPLLQLPWEPFQEVGALVAHGPAVYIDLKAGEWSQLEKAMRRSVRQQVRKLQREGFSGVIDRFSDLPQFCEIYQAAMQRLQADPYYYFDYEYFAGLLQSEMVEAHLCSILSPGGKLVAATIYLGGTGILDAFLTGCLSGYSRLGVSNLTYWYMMQWAKEQGWDFFHLGGGLGGADDSLLHFKRGFAKTEATFHTWRLICDESAYAALAVAAERPDSTAAGSFFPLYRSPVGS